MLDDIPLASFSFIAGVIIIVLGYLNNDLTVDQALIAAGAIGGGAGAIGHARNGAGRGMRK